MGSRTFLFLGLLFAIFLIASEFSATELAETEQKDETKALEESKLPAGGGCGPFGCGQLCPPRCLRICRLYGCCPFEYGCRCCTSAAEAEAYAAAQAKAKPQN